MRCLLRWDFSDFTDSAEGHFFWYAPLDGDVRIDHGSHEAPLEGLPSSLAWWRNNAKLWQQTKWDPR
jgi:hypothetical protein